ncbi:MAG: hypothetical protein U9N02_02875 [Campylobacterota bacterium]|nr:hypothetical protein [Campylobacterota bacterium]
MFDIQHYHAIKEGLLDGIEDFYENKYTNSNLLTCNFTDKEFYQDRVKKQNEETLNKLYMQQDASFRDFRQI